MVTELRIYFEGDVRLRPGFRKFFDEIYQGARAIRCRVELIATDGTPVQDFLNALKTHPDAWNVLLLDSDGPINSTREELCLRKGLPSSMSDSIFWMVQIMESWFLTDVEGLRDYFRGRFHESATRGNPNVEEILKVDVISRLHKAASVLSHKFA